MPKKINLKKSDVVVDIKNENVMEENKMQEVKPVENVVDEKSVVNVENPAPAPALVLMPGVEKLAEWKNDDHDGKADEKTANDGDGKKKERAKICPDALDVKTILEKHLSDLLPVVVQSMGDVENAEQLAKAKLYGAGCGIVNTITDIIENRFIAYAPRSYKGKNPSNHWLIWENTRKAVSEMQGVFEGDLAKLYNVTDENVYKLLENGIFAKSEAERTIKNFMPYMYVWNDVLLDEKIKEIDGAGIKTVLVKIYRFDNPQNYIKAFMSAGYMLAGFENVPAREYNGISKKFKAENDLYKFVKA